MPFSAKNVFLAALAVFLLPPLTTSAQPPTMPGDTLLAFVDVETTGLLPGHHEMIDLGLILTDRHGNKLGRLFHRVHPEHPERLSPGATAVNGYSVERWDTLGALTKTELVDRLYEFHRTHGLDDRLVLLVAYNCQFDTAFLDHLFRDTGRSWRDLYHYFVLDLPSMAWQTGLRGLGGSELNARLGIEDETRDPLAHTGITGAEFNVAFYKALQRFSRE